MTLNRLLQGKNVCCNTQSNQYKKCQLYSFTEDIKVYLQNSLYMIYKLLKHFGYHYEIPNSTALFSALNSALYKLNYKIHILFLMLSYCLSLQKANWRHQPRSHLAKTRCRVLPSKEILIRWFLIAPWFLVYNFN